MKAKDAPRLSALRMLKAAIMNKGVEKGRDLDDAEVLQVVASLVKQRRDSIEQFTQGRPHRSRRQGDRRDRRARGLPAAGGDAPRRSTRPSPRPSPRPAPPRAKDMGKVMKAVMPKLAGKNADGKRSTKPSAASLAPDREPPSDRHASARCAPPRRPARPP